MKGTCSGSDFRNALIDPDVSQGRYCKLVYLLIARYNIVLVDLSMGIANSSTLIVPLGALLALVGPGWGGTSNGPG